MNQNNSGKFFQVKDLYVPPCSARLRHPHTTINQHQDESIASVKDKSSLLGSVCDPRYEAVFEKHLQSPKPWLSELSSIWYPFILRSYLYSGVGIWVNPISLKWCKWSHQASQHYIPSSMSVIQVTILYQCIITKVYNTHLLQALRGFIIKKNYFKSSIHSSKMKVKNQVIQLQQKDKKIKDTTLSFHHFIQLTVSFNSFRLKLLKQCFASNELINLLSLI